MAKKFKLSPLPYEYSALEPHLSEETLKFHHDKHHATYVNKLNALIEGAPFEDMSLEEIILSADGKIFNNAAQVWNHDFYWQCLAKNKLDKPGGNLDTAIQDKYDSVDNFKKEFTGSAADLFGSGWTWLVLNAANELEIVNTQNAENPLTQDKIPLLTCDVWEHAYYIDYRNARPDYLGAFWKIVNWDFVTERYSKARENHEDFIPKRKVAGAK